MLRVFDKKNEKKMKRIKLRGLERFILCGVKARAAFVLHSEVGE